MRKLVIIPAVAASLAMSASFVLAADVTGVIKIINANAHEIVLDDGKTYSLPQTINIMTFKEGDKVLVSAEVQNGKNIVSKVTKAS